MNPALCDELPYWEFESDPAPHLILWDGALAAGLELSPLDVECFDESRINQIALGLRSFVNTLPEGLTCQLMVKIESDFVEDVANHEALIETTSPFLRNLDAERIAEIRKLMASGAVFRPSLHLFIKTMGIEKPSVFSFSGAKRFSNDFPTRHDDRMQSLFQALEGVISSLSALGIQAKTMGRENMIQLVYKFLNPRRALQHREPKVALRQIDLEGDSPRNQLLFGDLVLDQEDFVLDGLRTRILTLKTLPEVTFAGMMSGFLSFPFKYELVFTFRVPEQIKEIRSLEQKRRMAHSLANSTSNRVSDLESESRLSQTTDLIREIIETGQRIFQAELVVILREDNTLTGTKSLNAHTKEVLARFKSLSGAEGIQETVGSWKIFKSEMPFAPIHLERAKKMKTNNLADFLPLYGAEKGDKNPVVLLPTRQGNLYSFDPYSPLLTNFNGLATGASGSGKSMANNLLMLQQIARGTKVFIIDIGGSYKKLCEILGGQYFEINLSGRHTINPFELRSSSEVPNGERIKSLVNIIEQMIVDDGEKLTRFDRVQIEKTLGEMFKAARAKKISPQLSDFVRVCQDSREESLQRIGKLLFPWVGDSPYGLLLDRPGHVGVESSIVAFDLKGLSQHPDLQSVMILILTNFILDQVEHDRSSPKRVLLDEAWALLQSAAASSFMEYAARTFRKTGSGITFITQGIEEIVASGLGPAILNNTATKLVMLQKGDTQILKNQLRLNSQELRLIQSLEQRKGIFSEGFLMAGEARVVVRFRPSPLEYWISTSDARDNQLLADLIARGLSLEAALIKATELAPIGVAALKAEVAV